jgi:tetratricopeptide (TPR) repeat protein
MQYAQHLVDHGTARYEHGRWELPERLRERGLPATLDAMFEARLARLNSDARALALGLALARDESRSVWQPENLVHVEDFPRLLPDGDAPRAFRALDELLHAGVLQQRDSCYVLAQRALVDVLLRVTDQPTRAAAHLRVAEVFLQQGYAPFMGLRQLQLAGEDLRARALLTDTMGKLGSASMDWGTMRISVSTECARHALAHWQQHGGTPLEAIMLRRLLVLTCSVYDWSLAREGMAQIAQLQHDCGLDQYPLTDHALPDMQRVIQCFERGQARFDASPEAERGLPPGDAVRELSAACMPVSGAAAHSHDVAMSRSIPPVLEPLRPLSPLIGLLADSCVAAVERVTGHDIGDKLLNSVEALLTSALPEVLRLGAAAVNVHMQTVEDARRGRSRALEVIGRLAPFVGDDLFLVVHGRWLAHAFGGNGPQADRLRRQAEVITEDDVWRRRSFLFVEAELWALTGNLTGLRRTIDAIAPLAEKFPGWRPWLGYARAALSRLRGQDADARAELEAALALAQPGEHRAWTRLAPAHAELLLAREPEAALRECDAMLEAVAQLGIDLWAGVAAQRIRALALSALGRHDEARVALERAFALGEEAGFGGLPLALLHEARARLSLAAGAIDECNTALETMRAAIELAEAPALVQAYESLREESGRRMPASDLPAALVSSTAAHTATSTTFSDVRTRMNTCTERRDRARQALELLLEDSSAPGGHLFLFDAGGLFPAASHPGFANEKVLRVAQQYLETQREETKTGVVTTAQLGPSHRMAVARNEEQLVPVLIVETHDGRRLLTGVALLNARDGTVRMPREALVHAISRCLNVAGDSVPLAIDD